MSRYSIGIIVVAPALRSQQHAGADERSEVMGDVDRAARIRQVGGHPTDNPALIEDFRKSTAPESPVSLSTRLSMRKEWLNVGVTAYSVSPMRVSDAAVGFCLAD